MSNETENFIEIQYRKYFSEGNEINKDYTILYDRFPNENLKLLFSTMHADAIELFERMNKKLPTKDETGYYWAEESRRVLKLISVAICLRDELKNTKFAFYIDEYYDNLFEQCREWLNTYNGSTIPKNMDEIIIYYRKPLFSPCDYIPIQEFHMLGDLGECIGQGGFGAVYKYHHPYIDIDFAVKVFNPIFVSNDIDGEKRFFREAKMLFHLNHMNIIRIYDVGRIKGKPFIKMEFINGNTIDKIRDERGNLDYISASKAINQILSGLQYAHDKGIIHRDLKPTNIMVQMDEKKWTCKIIDFGISAFMDTENYTRLTKTGEQVAGGSYIDPELMLKPELRDVRSDIYSVGAIMYYLLCGRAPGPDAEAYLKKCKIGITDEQIAIVMKALSSDIEDRYSTCEEMKKELEKQIEELKYKGISGN